MICRRNVLRAARCATRQVLGESSAIETAGLKASKTLEIMTSSRSLSLYSVFAILVIVAAGVVRLGSSAPATHPIRQASLPSQAQEDAVPVSDNVLLANYGKLPLGFEPNQGQTDPRVKFLSRGPGYMLFLTADEAVLKLEVSPLLDRKGAVERAPAAPPATYRMKLIGANPNTQAAALDVQPGKSNYFIGNDPKLWRTNVPNYSRVQYRDAYPGIDLVYYGNPQQLEYDFVVAPGADPSAIALELTSSDLRASLRFDNGDLVLGRHGREVRLQKPLIYQERYLSTGKTRHIVDGRWVRKNATQVGFEIATYDRSQPLIVDPALTYCTYLGGSLDNSAYNVSADGSGNAYVTGNTTSTDFPTKAPFQKASAGTSDVFVSKLNSTGTALVYSTYLGGTGQDYAFWVSIDSTRQAHVVGSTGSANFPVTSGVLQPTCGGGCGNGIRNSFLTVLNPTGSGLVFSTYLGGTGQDQANSVIVDSSGNSYIAGWTTSANFPTTAGAFQTTYSGTSDSYVAKINPTGTALIYSTLLGVSNDNRAFGIQLDSALDTYIAGFTSSASFPTTAGAFQTTLKGASNAYVTEINPTGTGLVYSTYVGGSGSDIAWAIGLDSANNAYISGQTSSTDFPTTAGVLRTTCSTACSSNDAFVSKLNPTGTALVYSTYLGGTNGEQESYSLAVNGAGTAYATGRTKSTNFPTTPGAFFNRNRGVYDAFLAQLNATGSGLSYSTYLGGSMTDTALGIALDGKGSVYLVGRTYSPDLPVTPGAIQPTFVGNTQGWVAKFVRGAQVWPWALTFPTQTVGTTSSAQTVTLTNSNGVGLTISSIAIGGTNASDFAISNNTCGTSLGMGAACTVSVTFTPSASGTLAGTLTFTDSATNNPQVVALSGTGTTAAVTLTPGSLTFATQLVGTTSTSQPATLTNVGNTPVGISSIATSAQYTQTNNCPATLATHASCTINVAFQPTAAGSQTGTLTVTDTVAGTVTSTLSGTGTVMSFSPSSVNFGNQTVGTSSSPQAVTVSNVGTTPVTITKIGITGARVSSFSQTNNCPVSPATLAGGASCTVNVVFKPTLKGALTANLSFADNGGGSPQNVPLSGTGQ